MPYDLSDSVPIAVDVKDAAGALTNASTVTLTITQPDGTPTSPSVANPPSVTGQYRVTFIPTQVGLHAWRFVATGPNTAYEDVFTVRPTISPALISLIDAKSQLKITSTTSDDKLREYVEAATEIVESYVGPVVTRTHTARVRGWRCDIPLPHTQVTAITAITDVRTGTNPVTLSDLTVNGPAGIISYKNGAQFPYWEMDITYTVGQSTVKANWSLAAKIIVQHLWQTQLGNLPSTQGDTPGYAATGSGYIVPYQAIALLQTDQVPAGFA
jgi:hypothetical protein